MFHVFEITSVVSAFPMIISLAGLKAKIQLVTTPGMLLISFSREGGSMILRL